MPSIRIWRSDVEIFDFMISAVWNYSKEFTKLRKYKISYTVAYARECIQKLHIRSHEKIDVDVSENEDD